jgi:hypothetical protein
VSALVREWQCIQCLALASEPARPQCKNPSWHVEPAPMIEFVFPGGEGEFIEVPLAEPVPDEDGPFA